MDQVKREAPTVRDERQFFLELYRGTTTGLKDDKTRRGKYAGERGVMTCRLYKLDTHLSTSKDDDGAGLVFFFFLVFYLFFREDLATSLSRIL